MLRRSIVLSMLFGAVLVAPATASADRYVDAQTGNDANAPACASGAPCATIPAAVNAAAAGETIHVDGGTYTDNVILTGGKSLIEDDFVGGAAEPNGAVLATSAGDTVAVNTGESAGTISGLTISTSQANTAAIKLNGPATVTGNVFPLGQSNVHGLDANAGSNAAVISDNEFSDSTPSNPNTSLGVRFTDSSAELSGNEFSNLFQPIAVFGAASAPLVADNAISGTHFGVVFIPPFGSFPVGGTAISISGGTPTIARNSADGAAGATGIFVAGGGGTTLLGNRVTGGHSEGILITDATPTTSLDSNLVAGNDTGLRIADSTAPPFEVAVRNLTAFDNGTTDVFVGGASLLLDSSLVGAPISTLDGGTCTITNSRGPTTSGTACETFQTDAAPGFVGAGNYHLTAGSPLIDLGNPAAPPAGALDFDGDPRALDATPACSGNVLRRDIGADEFIATAPTGCPIETPKTDPIPEPKKKQTKCKQKPRKHAAAAKKKCKRKKKH